MKILHVVGQMNFGGAENMLMEMIRNLPSGVEFALLINKKKSQSNQRGSFDNELIERGCKLFDIGTQYELGYLKYYREFKNIVTDYQPDIIHLHLNAKSGFIAFISYLLGIKKVIVHCHADIRFRGSLINRIISTSEFYVQKCLINYFASDFWGCSVEANKRLFYNFNLSKSLVINNAINCIKYLYPDTAKVELMRKNFNFEANTKIIGSVGRIVRHKNIKFIIDILDELVNHRSLNYGLVVVGRIDDNEYYQEFYNYAKSKNLHKRVKHIEEQKNVEIAFNSFDLYVAPSLKEGFGIVAIESQACGIDTYLYQGFPKSVDMGLNLAHFFNHFEQSLWADSIINNSEKFKDFSKANILNNIQIKGFDSSQNTLDIINLYNKMLNKHE